MTTIAAVKKNDRLASAFSGYVIDHPEVMDRVPRNAAIVFEASRNPRLSAYNAKLAKVIRTRDKLPCYVAKKTRADWSLTKLP